jgi:hypothetical protein
MVTLHRAAWKNILSVKRISCHYVELSKISKMKSISKPLLPIGICTLCQNLSPDDYRNKSRSIPSVVRRVRY